MLQQKKEYEKLYKEKTRIEDELKNLFEGMNDLKKKHSSIKLGKELEELHLSRENQIEDLKNDIQVLHSKLSALQDFKNEKVN